MARMPRLTSLLGFTYGTSLTSRQPERISRSYPSSRSFFRSALRLIGRCDIEDHPVSDLDLAALLQGALGVGRRAVFIRDRVKNVVACRRRRVRKLHDLVKRNRLCRNDLLL